MVHRLISNIDSDEILHLTRRTIYHTYSEWYGAMCKSNPLWMFYILEI